MSEGTGVSGAGKVFLAPKKMIWKEELILLDVALMDLTY